ncbi:MAG: SRPBCC family protein [Alphaproteobacteria bacterium]|nr:SRPBCC family protein [Alphaproteobacteria bacterium]
MQFRTQASITIGAPADRVWAIISDDFGDIGHWCSDLAASRSIAGPGGDKVTCRRCTPKPGGLFGHQDVEEYLVENNASIRCLTYKATKVPKQFKNALNRWCVEEVSATKSKLVISPEVEVTPLFGFMFKLVSGRLLKRVLEDCKYYAETGTPHPRKMRLNQMLGRPH